MSIMFQSALAGHTPNLEIGHRKEKLLKIGEGGGLRYIFTIYIPAFLRKNFYTLYAFQMKNTF